MIAKQYTVRFLILFALALLMLFASVLFVETNLIIYIAHSKLRNKQFKLETAAINKKILSLEKKYRDAIQEVQNNAEFKFMQDSKMIKKREIEVYNHTQHEKRLIEAQHETILSTYQKTINTI